ncbi:hypothetical protein HYV82_03390 [Candidatus Woesearchaeota archaeon]|nr:hypothetical protein [Candidatus Woesearchaeota archaeon]
MRYIRLTGLIGALVALLLFLLIIVLVPVLIVAFLALAVIASVLSIPFLIAAKLRNRQKTTEQPGRKESRTIDAEYTIKKQD